MDEELRRELAAMVERWEAIAELTNHEADQAMRTCANDLRELLGKS